MKKQHIGFAAVGSAMTILFFIIVNYLTSPTVLWYIYPTIALLFWPLSLYAFRYGYERLHAALGSILVIAFLYTVNLLHSPEIWWVSYTLLPLVWWPVTMWMGKKAGTLSFAVFTSLCVIGYYAILNVSFAPAYPWAIYPAFAILWWPLVLYFVRRKNVYGLSVAGSMLTIIFFAIVNIVSSPDSIWAIYPAFAVLWWPLSMYYYNYKQTDQ